MNEYRSSSVWFQQKDIAQTISDLHGHLILNSAFVFFLCASIISDASDRVDQRALFMKFDERCIPGFIFRILIY